MSEFWEQQEIISFYFSFDGVEWGVCKLVENTREAKTAKR